DLQDRHLVGPELTGEQRQVVYREELARLKAFVLERELLQPPEQPCSPLRPLGAAGQVDHATRFGAAVAVTGDTT
ncbi:hypothetical protein QQ73_08295, partial [Candidatus Endoriftia persephone str. Guaymas]|nr:hypothetical protein [Candidatus Endoriftia persephone str. Guaymas]